MSNIGDKQRKALGRGLSALLPNRQAHPPDAPAAADQTPAAEHVPPPPAQAPVAPGPQLVPIGEIKPNPLQPRSSFRADRLEELAQSIRANGIIQPIIVRRSGANYQIVAGERRWRAAQLAELETVPVIVQDIADSDLLEIALIENIQRDDLNPMEVAHAFDRLTREMNLTHEEIGRRTGKDRSTVANTVRLLRLPQEVQLLLAEHRLSMGQARAILGLPTEEQQIQIGEKAASQGLSVRQVEALVTQLTERDGARPAKKEQKLDPNVRAAVDELERVLGTRVKVVELTDKRGRIEIEYYSQDDLDRIYGVIVGENSN
ncbi:MAG: ParB/RepB/Spo0J family partition protein [Bryobacteraceae bacterium]